MRYIHALLIILFCIHSSTAQDSLKTDYTVIQIQAYPDSTTGYFYPKKMIADVQNGLWISLYPIDSFPHQAEGKPFVKAFDPNVQYFLTAKKGNAIIVKDPNNKHVFYVTPIKKKLQKMKKPVIELELWVLFNSKNAYFPMREPMELPFRAENAQSKKAGIKWKKYEDLKSKDGKILIGTNFLSVKLE